MERNKENNTLLIRALEKGRREPTCDLTQRIMECVDLRMAQNARRERAMLLAGAILGGAVILTLGIWIMSRSVDAETFASLRNAFVGFSHSLHELFTPTNTTAPDDNFMTGLYCYTAAVFLALSLLGEWLRRRYGSGSAHQ